MAQGHGAGDVELQEAHAPHPQPQDQEEEAIASYASPKEIGKAPAMMSNVEHSNGDEDVNPFLDDGVNYKHVDLIPKPWHPGDEEFDNDAERWEDIQAFGCIPRVVQGRCCGFVRYYVNPIVMTLGILIIWGFVIWCAVDPLGAGEKLGEANVWTVTNLGWFYILCVAIFGFFSMYLVCTKYGDIVLGPPGEPPKYSYPTWFAMLFSAGVGIGLYFFGVAEAVFHLDDAQNGKNRWYHETTNNQALAAMNITWFHWGFTASATYVVAALPLAYHHHVHNEPIRESVCFIILLGHQYANGILGHLIDLTSVVSTMFGVSTSLGLGVIQINSGLAYAFGVEESVATQMWIIWGITACATISVLTGVDRGIRRLSEINFNFSLILMFFVFFATDTIFIINLLIQTFGYHIQYQIQLIFDTASFEQARFFDTDEPALLDNIDDLIESQAAWMQWWTPFYWAWWVAWAPFVGIFIAQISRGRTVREFVIGNMLVPTLFTCIWLGIFGGLGLYNELGSIQNGVECDGYWDSQPYTSNSTNISTTMVWETSIESVHNDRDIIKLSCFDTPQMMWAALDTLPLPGLTKVLALIGIIIYFVTSSDSASHVIDVLTASGNEDPPTLQRLFWAISEGAVAAVLLSTGDNALTALQTASLVAAAPFAVVLLCETYATWLTLRLHCGEYTPRLYVYWRYDLFAIFEKAGLLKVLIGLVCPPYFHTMTRLKIIEYARNSNHADSSERNGNPADSFGDYKDDEWKYIWIVSYWLTWFMTVLFFVLEVAVGIDGMMELCLTSYVFYMGVVVVNRNAVRTYYKIDSSNSCYGCLAWLFCCCFAVVQENLQTEADYSVDLRVGADSAAAENEKLKSEQRATILSPTANAAEQN